MAVTITISDKLHRRLEERAIGFDTPERVIERLLDAIGETNVSTEKKPELTFHPTEKQFKAELLIEKRAEVIIYTKNSGRYIVHWDASRLKPESNLRGNLWSGHLRNWKEKGIVSAEFSVLKCNDTEDKTERNIAVARELKMKLDEVKKYLINVEEYSGNDGHSHYLAHFREDTPEKFGLGSASVNLLFFNAQPDK